MEIQGRIYILKFRNKGQVVGPLEVRVIKKDGEKLSEPKLAVLEGLNKIQNGQSLATGTNIYEGNESDYDVSVQLKGKGETIVRYYKLVFEPKIYSVTVANGVERRIELNPRKYADIGPKRAALEALKLDPNYSGKSFELVADKKSGNVTVELKNGKRNSLTHYRIESKDVKINTDSIAFKENINQVKLRFISEFREIEKKEKKKFCTQMERYASTNPQEFDDLISKKWQIKTAIKELSKTKEVTATDIAKLAWDKNSKDFESMLTQASIFTDEFEDIDVTNKQNMLDALNQGPCIVLARKQGGGITGYIGTTNLKLHSALYEENMWARFKLIDIYSSIFSLNSRKIGMVKREIANPPSPRPQTQLDMKSIASVSMRVKINARTGKKEISSTDYSLVFDNVICMKLYRGNIHKIEKSIRATINQVIMDKVNLSNSMENFNFKEHCSNILKEFGIVPFAYYCANSTLENNSIPSNFEEVVIKNAISDGISEEDARLYYKHRVNGIMKDVKYVLDRNNAGTL